MRHCKGNCTPAYVRMWDCVCTTSYEIYAYNTVQDTVLINAPK